jgi:uncharacterized membrane protein YidH (DUF202 family)
MEQSKYYRLVSRGEISAQDLESIVRDAGELSLPVEELLLRRGVPRHEVLFCLGEYYGVPFVEYDESVIVSQQITRRMDMERLKRALWLPVSVTGDRAEVIACRPGDPAVLDDVRKILGVSQIDFKVALPSDLVRIIEHNQDLNPGFPSTGGRTTLAKVRTFLADRRSMLASYRTSLAKGRTGLAFLRTGISFITISLLLFRVFGLGYLTIMEGLLFASGFVMAVDGFRWYLPARRVGKKPVVCRPTEPTGGTTVLEVSNPGDNPVFARSAAVPGADELRNRWNGLSPVMRRRFLASDRTDLAEERTVLACYRTLMARSRTGLSFTRTGFAFIGLGIALTRQFPAGPWSFVDAALILTGVVMVAEGFYWYLPGRRAGRESSEAVMKTEHKPGIWEFVFPPRFRHDGSRPLRTAPPVRGFASPGIWATTGLALERTLLAERRNVMARLRTVMARSRTGMALLRTGMAISAVGLGLLVYFGTGNVLWALFNWAMIIAGLLFIADGLFWHIPAERTREQYPYCFGDMEITVPDYGKPARAWKKAVFSHDDL